MTERIIEEQVRMVGEQLLALGEPEPGKILVVGCSTSEVSGAAIGSASQLTVAEIILPVLLQLVEERKMFLAIQCCEHLNRALVVEKELIKIEHLTQVHVYPMPKAGGSIAHAAMQLFAKPVVVEQIAADYGMDMGDTFIGMHLKPVAVPVRMEIKMVGHAHVTFAYSRPKLIGGERAIYEIGR